MELMINIFSLVGSLALFLFGMKTMSEGLEKFAGKNLPYQKGMENFSYLCRQEAKTFLRTTDMSIREITDVLHFPTDSFFC